MWPLKMKISNSGLKKPKNALKHFMDKFIYDIRMGIRVQADFSYIKNLRRLAIIYQSV